jgi:hypothetical protein
MSRWLLGYIVISLLGTSGCKIERRYTHVQTEDGLGMKAPITHTVRIRVNTASRTVTWMQDLKDVLGVEDRKVTEYGGDGAGVCDVFDEYNWSCSFAPTETAVEAPTMKDGRLSRFYWEETVSYRTRYSVLGIPLNLRLPGRPRGRTTPQPRFDFDSLDRALDNYSGPRDSLGRIPLDTIFAGMKRR